jgi:hypothetical protein
MTVFFKVLGSGIGDVVVCKSTFESFCRNTTENVVFVARGPRQVGLSKLLDGAVSEVKEFEIEESMKDGDSVINLRDHPWQREHDWFSADFKVRYPNIKILEILDDICRDKGIAGNARAFKPFAFEFDSRAANKVIVMPGTTMKAKKMKPTFWQNLVEQLRAKNIQTIMLGSADASPEITELVDLGIEHIATPELQDAINLISSSKAVVSVDTGLMHIAVQQGIKTVAIFGQCEIYYRPAGNCIPVFTDRRISEYEFTGQYKLFDFAVDYDSWDYLPPASNDGALIKFDDSAQIIALLGLGKIKKWE